MSILFAIKVMEINTLAPDEHKFLQRLGDVADPPKRLCFMGNLPTSDAPVVAIVGSRKPTSYGREVTERLATDLARAGCVVVSGLALGVDCIAQAAALAAGGVVVGVVTNELPDISPRSNQRLAESIMQKGGAIISEWQRGDGKTIGKWSFLERNRLVSGLADAVIITEAAARSGTLNTAMRALEQGKDVFVIPGNITSPSSAGCNLLLKQGAIPVTDVDDILERIAPQLINSQTQLALGTTDAEVAILTALKDGLRDGDEIQRATGVDPSEFATSLTMLELSGAIKSLGANQWTLR